MKKILVFIVLVMALFGATYAEESSNFDLEVNIGNKGTVYVDKKIPINITITNNSSDFDGTIKVMLPMASNSQEKKYYSYDYIMQIAAGESKKVETLETADASLEPGNVIIELVNKNDSIVYKENYRIRKTFEVKTSVAILSEDFDSLSYIKSTKTYNLVNLADRTLDIENAFSIYDVIFINFYETTKFSDKTVASLENFVNEGGQLVIGTGQYMDKSLKKLDFIGDINVGEIKETSSLEIQKITNVEVNSESNIKFADITADGYKEINKFILKKNIGSGSVVISKVSFGDSVFKGYFGSDKFINEFLEYKADISKNQYRNNSNYYINNYIAKIPKKFMPDPSLLTIFMIVFVLLVGPITYIILNHLDKRDYGFIIIIAIVLVSIGGIKAYGYALNSNSDIVNHLSLLSADGDNLNVESYVGFKGSKGNVDIEFDKKYEISRYVQNNYDMESGLIYSKYSDENNHIVFYNSKQWEFNKVKVNANEPFDSKMVSSIEVDGTNLKLNFKNELGYDVEDLFFVYGNRIFYKSDLAEGEIFDFDKDISAMHTSNGGSISQSLYGYNSVLGLDQDYLKNDIINGFFNNMENGEAGAFLLLSSNDYSLEIKNERSKKEQKLAYVYIPLEIEFKKGKDVNLTSGVIKETVVESFGMDRNSYNGFYNGNGFITFEYKIPDTLELKSFELKLHSANNNLFYEVYNTKADIWEKVNSASNSFAVTEDKVKNYSDGSIKVKITATDYMDFEGPEFKFKGVGK